MADCETECVKSNADYCYSKKNTCPSTAMSAVETKEECKEALVSLGFHVGSIDVTDMNHVEYPKGCFAHTDNAENPYFNVNGNEHSNQAIHTDVVCKLNGACGEFYWTTIDSIYLLY